MIFVLFESLLELLLYGEWELEQIKNKNKPATVQEITATGWNKNTGRQWKGVIYRTRSWNLRAVATHLPLGH